MPCSMLSVIIIAPKSLKEAVVFLHRQAAASLAHLHFSPRDRRSDQYRCSHDHVLPGTADLMQRMWNSIVICNNKDC